MLHRSVTGQVQLSVAKEIDLRTMPRAALEEQAFKIRSGSGFGRSTFWFRVPQQLGLQVFETPDEIRQLLSHEASAPALSVVRVSKDFVFIAAFWY